MINAKSTIPKMNDFLLLLIGSHLQLIQKATAFKALISARNSDHITPKSPMFHQLYFTIQFVLLLICSLWSAKKCIL